VLPFQSSKSNVGVVVVIWVAAHQATEHPRPFILDTFGTLFIALQLTESMVWRFVGAGFQSDESGQYQLQVTSLKVHCPSAEGIVATGCGQAQLHAGKAFGPDFTWLPGHVVASQEQVQSAF
jgi:hypothetical protein